MSLLQYMFTQHRADCVTACQLGMLPPVLALLDDTDTDTRQVGRGGRGRGHGAGGPRSWRGEDMEKGPDDGEQGMEGGNMVSMQGRWV